MANPSVSMSDGLQEAIDDQRHAATSRAGWIREAIRVRLLLEKRGEFDAALADAPAVGALEQSDPDEQPAD